MTDPRNLLDDEVFLCESCNTEHEGDAEDHRCHGCEMVVCLSCSNLFDHRGTSGLHGRGNPGTEAARLRADNARYAEALRYYADTPPDPYTGPWRMQATDFGKVARTALSGDEATQ
jgi:hypothetical protein